MTEFVYVVALVCVTAIVAIVYGRKFSAKVNRDEFEVKTDRADLSSKRRKVAGRRKAASRRRKKQPKPPEVTDGTQDPVS